MFIKSTTPNIIRINKKCYLKKTKKKKEKKKVIDREIMKMVSELFKYTFADTVILKLIERVCISMF